jgi:hypothetical protein
MQQKPSVKTVVKSEREVVQANSWPDTVPIIHNFHVFVNKWLFSTFD